MHTNILKLAIIFLFGLQISFSFPIFAFNSSKTLTLTPNSFNTFQIQKSTDTVLGTFQITISLPNKYSLALALITRQNCEQDQEEELLPYELMSFQGISFVADAFDNNCFNINIIDVPEQMPESYTIDVTFVPIESRLMAGAPFAVELLTNEEKEFSYMSKDGNIEMVLITVHTINYTMDSQVKLRDPLSRCLKTKSEASWLCYLTDRLKILTFFLINPAESQFYNIAILEMTCQNPYPDTEVVSNYMIPDFGTFIKVNVPSTGILKVEAKTPKNDYIPIIGAPSLNNLFEKLALGLTYPANFHTTEGLVAQNKYPNTSWYYFIQKEQASESFRFTSHFIEQTNIEVNDTFNTQAAFYINPAIYEYHHLQMDLSQGPGDYEVLVYSDSPENKIIIYFDSSTCPIEVPLFPDQYVYKKRTSEMNDQNVYSLSFTADKLDSSVYLSVQAFKKGLYVLKARKIESFFIWKALLIIGGIVLLIYSFFCIVKICNTPKTEDLVNPIEPREIPREVELPTILEISNNDIPEDHIGSADTEASTVFEAEIETKAEPRSKSMIRMVTTLKRLYKLERLERLKRQDDEEKVQDKAGEHEVIEINEEENCDICYVDKKTVTFEPCGHRCSCIFCALAIIKTSVKCPLCRGEITGVKVNSSIQIN